MTFVENIDKEWKNEKYPAELSQAIDLIGRDHSRALVILNDLMKKGSILSMVYLGDMYAHSRGVDENIDCAIYWYAKSSEEGSIEGTFRLAFELWYKSQQKESMKLLDKIASRGFSPAAYVLGSIYSNGDFVKKNDIEAVNYWTLAETQGHLMAKRRLSIYLRSGQGGFLGRIRGYFKLAGMIPEFLRVSVNHPNSERLRGWRGQIDSSPY